MLQQIMPDIVPGLFMFLAGIFIELSADNLLKKPQAKRFTQILGLFVITLGIVWAVNSFVISLTDRSPVHLPPKDIHIAVAITQLAAGGEIGVPQERGAEIAEGIFAPLLSKSLGLPLRVTLHDAKSDADSAKKVFTKLTDKKNSDFVAVIGPSYSEQACKASHVVSDAEIPIIGPSNTAPCVLEAGPYVSRVSVGVDKFTSRAVGAARKEARTAGKTIRYVSILHLKDNAFTEAESSEFEDAVNDFQYEIKSNTPYDKDPNQLAKVAASVLESTPTPDLIIISGLTRDGGALIKHLRDQGYDGFIVGGNGLNTRGLIHQCNLQCEGVLLAEAYNPNPTAFNTDPEVKELNKEFVSTYRSIVGEESDPLQFTAQMFTAFQVIADSLKAIDSDGKPIKEMKLQDIRTELNDILHGNPSVTFKTILGTMTFTGDGDIRITQADPVYSRIKMDPQSGNGVFEKKYLNR